MNFVGPVPKGRSGTSGFVGISGVSGRSGYSGVAPASNPSAIVSGAGTAAANGTYTQRGTFDGGGGSEPYYNLIGQPDNPVVSSIYSNGVDSWAVTGSGGEFLYSTTEVALPWLGTWNAEEGDPPAPTVVQG